MVSHPCDSEPGFMMFSGNLNWEDGWKSGIDGIFPVEFISFPWKSMGVSLRVMKLRDSCKFYLAHAAT